LRYKSEQELVKVFEGAAPLTDGTGEVKLELGSPGSFRVRVSDPKSGAAASEKFYVYGDDRISWSMEDLDRVDLSTDQDDYTIGEVAKLSIRSPVTGKALVFAETDRVLWHRTIPLANGSTEIEVPITAEMKPNAYCSVVALKGIDPNASTWEPHRAFGVVPIAVNCTAQELDLELTVPEEIRPGSSLRVEVSAPTGQLGNTPTEVAIAAVDEGILRLTGFGAPDPHGFFFAKRKRSTSTADLYARLMPERRRERVGADSSPAGDDVPESYLNPVSVQRVEPVALWRSGIRLGPGQSTTATFDVPEFTGNLKLMAVAVGRDRVGFGTAETKVRRPLMMTVSLPRFAAMGDRFDVPVTLTNTTDSPGQAEVHVRGDGPVEAEDTDEHALVLAPKEEKTLRFSLRAGSLPGEATVRVFATLNGEDVLQATSLSIRPPAGRQSVQGCGRASATHPANITLPRDLMMKTAEYSLAVSGLPTLELGAALDYVMRYPYGCVEQTTSSAFPLLYLADIAKMVDPERFGQDEVNRVVEAGFLRLLSMQTLDGGLAWWPGGTRTYPWGSVYGAHFLVEARKAGYAVPRGETDALLRCLRDFVRGEHQFSSELEEDDEKVIKAYACFVLALAGQPETAWQLELEDEKEDLPAYSRCHLAAARLASGQKEAALKLIGGPLPARSSKRETGGVLHSSVREYAIILSALLDVDPSDARVPVLVRKLNGLAKRKRWATTQENAFALMALGRYARFAAGRDEDFTATLSAGGQPVGVASAAKPATFAFDGADVPDRITMRVAGPGAAYYYWTARGVPLTAKTPNEDKGLQIRRRYLRHDGTPVESHVFEQGDTYVVEVSIKAERPIDNLVVADLLPAGLEIENPRLATSDHAGLLDEGTVYPNRVEMRDDRLLLFLNVSSTRRGLYRYVVRAVTCGSFSLPAVTGECMYDPSVASVHGAGKIKVVRGL